MSNIKKDKLRPIDALRKQMIEDVEKVSTPTINSSKTNNKFPSVHHRSISHAGNSVEFINRDISHRYDMPARNKSCFDVHEIQLQEILGIKQEMIKMPTDLAELQNMIKKNTEEDTKELFIQDLENMKLQTSLDKEKFLGKVIKEGGLLYRTQSGLIQPHVAKIYDQILKKNKNNCSEISRNDIDLGAPSGRKEVEIIIA